MDVCNYFYLSQSAVTPIRSRIQFLYDGGFIAKPLYDDFIRYLTTISATLDYYSDTVKKGLGEYDR